MTNPLKDIPASIFNAFERELFDGYFDGLYDHRADFPAESNRTKAYRHGWLNGRDDRLHAPRALAQELREEADRLEREFYQ